MSLTATSPMQASQPELKEGNPVQRTAQDPCLCTRSRIAQRDNQSERIIDGISSSSFVVNRRGLR